MIWDAIFSTRLEYQFSEWANNFQSWTLAHVITLVLETDFHRFVGIMYLVLCKHVQFFQLKSCSVGHTYVSLHWSFISWNVVGSPFITRNWRDCQYLTLADFQSTLSRLSRPWLQCPCSWPFLVKTSIFVKIRIQSMKKKCSGFHAANLENLINSISKDGEEKKKK